MEKQVREFEICMLNENGKVMCPAYVTTDEDILGVIGHVLELISQLDPGEQVVINCYGD